MIRKKTQDRSMEKGLVALVTGAGRRLGRQIAMALAGKGYLLALHFNESRKGAEEAARTIRSLGGEALTVRANISDPRQVKRMVAHVSKAFGRIDLLVNNAGVFEKSTLESTSERTWDRIIDINLKGSFFAAQAVGTVMRKQGSGRIINIASLGGIQAWPGHFPYSISKAGVIMLTRLLAKALAPAIAVNAIAPGTIIIPQEEDPLLEHIPVKGIPLGRYGEPKDITEAVIFLASAASYMTGQVLIIDGGRSIQ